MECQAQNSAGGRCKATPGADGWCFMHRPGQDAARTKARRRGREGQAAKQRAANIRTVPPDEAPPAPETLEDCIRWASWATWAAATGKIDGRTAHEIGYLLNALRGALKERGFEAEVERLRTELGKIRKEGLKAV